MKQGKFEARRKDPEKPRQSPEQAESGKKRKWLLILAPILALVVIGAAVTAWILLQNRQAPQEPEGLTKEETLAFFQKLAAEIENKDMVLTISPDDPDFDEEPIVLTVSPYLSRVRVDLRGVEADLEAGIGRVAYRRYLLDPQNYVSLDRSALRELAERTASDHAQDFLESFALREAISAGEEQVETLTINTGRRGMEFTAEDVYQTLLEAYFSGDLEPRMRYRARTPQLLDVEAIRTKNTKEPVNAVLNEETFEITPEIPGYGLEPGELEAVLERAVEGKGYIVPLHAITPEITYEDVEAALYADVLGEAHTPHSWIDDRTHNLQLSCAEIDGTVVMPGQIFSFNEVVGERTAEKGYREATAYVGGASVPEIGGGVCQVASSIYYAVLQADLKSVERHGHTYLVTYVPMGMDAAIYWGLLDYQFENTSPYPIKIEASVSDGDVHIILRGTEWKDYSVKLSYKVLEEVPWETVERYVYSDNYKVGDTIVTPYKGYLVSTYRSVIDAEGNTVEKTLIATTRYRKRDKVVAAAAPQPKPTEPADTGSSNDD